jgi:hypothetical protein
VSLPLLTIWQVAPVRLMVLVVPACVVTVSFAPVSVSSMPPLPPYR